MKFAFVVAACMLAALPAHAQSAGEKTGVNAVMGISPSTQDFITEAAVSDMFEVQSSELATQKSNDGATKEFAQKMIQDHTKTTSELKSLVTGGKVPGDIPSAMDSSHQSKLDKLKTLTGVDFDKQYHKDQDSGHKDAVSLFERYAKGGDNGALKDWASTTLPHLQDHLQQAKALDQ